MGVSDVIRQRLLAGDRPYSLLKEGFARPTVYAIYNKMVSDGQLTGGSQPPINPISVDTEPDDEGPDDGEMTDSSPFGTQPKKSPTMTIKRSTPSPTGKTANVINFTGTGGLPFDAVNAARGALGMALVPSILRMPMPELLYTAMVTSISEFSWPPMQPQDFIDTVLKQWLEACDIITRPIIKKADLQAIVDKANIVDENSPGIKKFLADKGYLTQPQVNDLINSAIERIKKETEAANNGNGHNGNGKNGGEKTTEIPTATIEPDIHPASGAEPKSAIEITVKAGPVTQEVISATLPTEQEVVTSPVIIKAENLQPPKIEADDLKTNLIVGSTKVQDIKSMNQVSESTLIASVPGVLMWIPPRLRENGITTMGQLTTRTVKDLEKMPNLGDAMAMKINQWVTAAGFKLKSVDVTPEEKHD